MATLTSVNPSSGPPSGGTAVTITGSGFGSGVSFQAGRASVGAGAGTYGVSTVYADKFSLPAPGLAQSISVHVKAFPTARSCTLGIYADNGGAPGALLASTPLSPFASAPEGWLTIGLSSPVSLAPGSYWIAVLWSVATDCYITASGGSLVAEYAVNLRDLFGSPPDINFAPAGISAYATLSAAVSGATVGGVALTSFVVVNDTTITGVTGAHAAGAVDVVVTVGAETTTLAGGYTYVAPPPPPLSGTGMVRPIVRYRTFRSDDLSKPLLGPLNLEVQSIAMRKEGAAFEARAPRLSLDRTGETYDLVRFPALRGFL